ncbi:MetQ/NlpA family ABC transporter substrate-binding protein [Haloplasma contractile]|uniref:Lipoprotein n=1 Tax=Haloplasma contractile SSD-17B TaxID=1033810 RepID=F7PVM3_9MOLU|nr:MetQ/NlpA family ABC transporter substrate-binding protein [Haloplasma contractile]ERJ12811.1 ABC-type metal ion transport system protein [Haloplasma contractile SSD-17B]
MKKLSILFILVSIITVLTACGSQAENKIVVGATNVPHAEILEFAKPILKEKGYELEIVEFQDYVLPNLNLTEGELDANYFQHIPYLELYNKEHGTNIVNAGGIHIEPIGIYSPDASIDSLDDIENGSIIIISKSVSDHPRVLRLLNSNGLISLPDGVNFDPIDIDELEENTSQNPNNLTFKQVDAGYLVTAYNNDEGAAVLINTNFALDGGLNPLEDAIAIEGADSPYVNVVAVNDGDQNTEKIKALVDVLQSEEVKQFIIDTYDGAVVAVN